MKFVLVSTGKYKGSLTEYYKLVRKLKNNIFTSNYTDYLSNLCRNIGKILIYTVLSTQKTEDRNKKAYFGF